MKLVDKDALVAEIEKRIKEYQESGDAYYIPVKRELKEILSFIDSLEVKAMEKEKVVENIIDAELYSDGMLLPLIGVKDKEKLDGIKFGNKLKIAVYK